MPTKSISTQQAGQVLDATHFLQISGGPCRVYKLEGNVNSTTGTNYYIQLLGVSQANAVSGTTVPLFSVLAVPSAYGSAVNGFSFIYPVGLDTARMKYPVGATTAGENSLPVYAALSSTDTVYTAVAGNTDLTVTIEQSFVDLPNETKLVTNAAAQSIVWADSAANTNKRLVNFTYDGTGTVNDVYVQLSSFSPSLGTIPLAVWLCKAGKIISESFGSGLIIQQMDALYVQHYGCYLSSSSTPLTYTASGEVPTSITSNVVTLS